MASLNKNNSAVKRIMQEARELANDPSTEYSAAPLEDDIFEWHCTLRGPEGTDFDGGLYHFRILLPAEYPFRPPSIMILTPNGRFELNTKICISFTSYHEELWQPAWGVRTAIIGLQGFFPLKGQATAGVGSIEYPISERKRLAALSRDWVCPHCQQSNIECLPDPTSSISSTGPEAGAVPENTSPRSPENILSPITSVPAPSGPPLGTIEDRPTVHVVSPLTSSPSSSSPGTPFSTAPASFVGHTRATESPQVLRETMTRHGPTGHRHGHKPPVLLTVDTAIFLLVGLAVVLVCRRLI